MMYIVKVYDIKSNDEKELRFDLPSLKGTEKEIEYASYLREQAIKKFCNAFRRSAFIKGIETSLEERCLSYYKTCRLIDFTTASAKEIIEALGLR